MTNQQSEYAKAGVDIDAGQKAVELMSDAIKATYTPEVLSNTGNFGGLFAATSSRVMVRETVALGEELSSKAVTATVLGPTSRPVAVKLQLSVPVAVWSAPPFTL